MVLSRCQYMTVGLLSILSLVRSQGGTNPPCYICDGDATATIANPTTIVMLPDEYATLVGVTELPCSAIFNAGVNGVIPADLCDFTTPDADELQRVCGCSNFVAPTPVVPPVDPPVVAPVPVVPPVVAPVPVDAPVDAPVEPPVDAPVDAPVEPPVDVPVDAPVDVPVDAPVDIPVDAPVDVPVEAPTGDDDCPEGKGGKGKGSAGGSGKGKGGSGGKGMGMKSKKCKGKKESKVPKEPKTKKAKKSAKGSGKGGDDSGDDDSGSAISTPEPSSVTDDSFETLSPSPSLNRNLRAMN